MNAPKPQPRRAEILNVATNLFCARGFHGTRMDDVADAARLNKATVYHYYDTKATILFELCLNAIDAILDELKDLDSIPSAADALAEYTRSLFHVIAAHPRRALVYFQESPFLGEWLSEEQVAQIRQRERVYESHLRRIMTRGVDAGTFKDFDPRFMALGYSGLSNWFCRWYHPDGDRTPDQIAEQFVSMFLGGLLSGSPARLNGGGPAKKTAGRVPKPARSAAVAGKK